MRQVTLDLAARELRYVPVKASIGELYARENRECARIIKRDAVNYPGVMQEWADKVLRK